MCPNGVQFRIVTTVYPILILENSRPKLVVLKLIPPCPYMGIPTRHDANIRDVNGNIRANVAFTLERERERERAREIEKENKRNTQCKLIMLKTFGISIIMTSNISLYLLLTKKSCMYNGIFSITLYNSSICSSCFFHLDAKIKIVCALITSSLTIST